MQQWGCLMRINSFSPGSTSPAVGRDFMPSILAKFKGRKIMLFPKALKAKNLDSMEWENKSLCSRLITCSGKKSQA